VVLSCDEARDGARSPVARSQLARARLAVSSARSWWRSPPVTSAAGLLCSVARELQGKEEDNVEKKRKWKRKWVTIWQVGSTLTVLCCPPSQILVPSSKQKLKRTHPQQKNLNQTKEGLEPSPTRGPAPLCSRGSPTKQTVKSWIYVFYRFSAANSNHACIVLVFANIMLHISK
jgi:hypothetical protein